MAVQDEVEQHRTVAETLEHGVKNRDWFLWVEVVRSAKPLDPSGLDGLVQDVEHWLDGLDPDLAPESPPERDWRVNGLNVSLRALHKKPQARGSEPLVGNPYPAFASWVAG